MPSLKFCKVERDTFVIQDFSAIVATRAYDKSSGRVIDIDPNQKNMPKTFMVIPYDRFSNIVERTPHLVFSDSMGTKPLSNGAYEVRIAYVIDERYFRYHISFRDEIPNVTFNVKRVEGSQEVVCKLIDFIIPGKRGKYVSGCINSTNDPANEAIAKGILAGAKIATHVIDYGPNRAALDAYRAQVKAKALQEGDERVGVKSSYAQRRNLESMLEEIPTYKPNIRRYI